MIDSLLKYRKNFKEPKVWEDLNLKENYILADPSSASKR